LIIAQRRISVPNQGESPIASRGKSPAPAVSLRAHKLAFGPSIDLKRPYIFSQLGDEVFGVGCVDLHITFRSVRDWKSVLKKASFGGWDQDVTVHVSREEVREKKRVVWDFEKGCKVGEGDGRPGKGWPWGRASWACCWERTVEACI